MCGLVGFMSFNQKEYQAKRAFMYQGLYMSALRGFDSTGIASIGGPKDVPDVLKRAMASNDFLDLKVTEKMLSNSEKYRAFMGHTRSSTRGAIKNANAHPFQHGHITLTHNGTVHGYHSLVSGTVPDVDSEAVCLAFSQRNPKEVLESITGDYCFIWHDAKEGTFNIAKNGGRPLFWAYIPEWDGLAYCSEMGLLASILHRNGIKIGGEGKYWYPENHQIYTWDLSASSLPEVSVVPFAERKTHTAYGGNTTGSGTDYRRNRRSTYTEYGSPNIPSYELMMTSRREITEIWDLEPEVRDEIKEKRGYKKVRKNGLDPMKTYSVNPRGFFHYFSDQKKGFGYFAFAGSKNADKACIIHDMTREEYRDVAAMTTIWCLPYDVVRLGVNNKYPVFECVLSQLPGDNKRIVLDTNALGNDDDEDDDASSFQELVPGPSGVYIPLEEWNELTKDGCSNCTGACNPTQALRMLWIGEGGRQPVCHECAEELTSGK